EREAFRAIPAVGVAVDPAMAVIGHLLVAAVGAVDAHQPAGVAAAAAVFPHGGGAIEVGLLDQLTHGVVAQRFTTAVGQRPADPAARAVVAVAGALMFGIGLAQ